MEYIYSKFEENVMCYPYTPKFIWSLDIILYKTRTMTPKRVGSGIPTMALYSIYTSQEGIYYYG